MNKNPDTIIEKMRRGDNDPLIEETLRANAEKANKLCGGVFLVAMLVCVTSVVLNLLGVFKLSGVSVMGTGMAAACMLVAIVCNRIGRINYVALKCINIGAMIVTTAMLDYVCNYNATLVIVIPVVLSSMYFSRRTVVVSSIITAVLFAVETYLAAVKVVLLDNNHVVIPDGRELVIKDGLKNTLLSSGFDVQEYTFHMMVMAYLPKLLVLAIVVAIAMVVARYGQNMALRQAGITAEQTRISTELDLAGSLQQCALPDVSMLETHHHIDLAAAMRASREMGGDFYDFIMLDEDHLALLVADVSDKGVPAAMFMMNAKARLDSALSKDKTPGQVLAEVNNCLCINNGEDMFVTVWLGIVDLNTGVLTSANAGHENHIIRSGREYREIREPHGVFLGEFENMKYKDYEDSLDKGDVLVLYTDGVTEACDSEKNMFGMERLLGCLNEKCGDPEMTAEEIMETVKHELADFAGGAEQFDDITMMVFKF